MSDPGLSPDLITPVTSAIAEWECQPLGRKKNKNPLQDVLSITRSPVLLDATINCLAAGQKQKPNSLAWESTSSSWMDSRRRSCLWVRISLNLMISNVRWIKHMQ